MATVLGNIGNDFYEAFSEPEVAKRRAAFDAWIKAATPKIQAAVEGELKEFVEWICQDRWTEAGWKTGNNKLHRIQNDYPLVLDIKLRKLGGGEKYIGQLPDKVYYKPPISADAPAAVAPKPSAAATYDCGDDGYDDDDGDGGHGSHDDQAAMDNHADQMNPNNDAYWSSRG